MGAYTLLQDLTVATNSTSVVLNDFGTITKDDFVKVVTTFVNATANTNDIFLYSNTATSNTDYHVQILQGTGSSVFAGRINQPRITEIDASQTTVGIGYLKISENNRVNYFISNNRNTETGVRVQFWYATSSGATFANGINTLTFTGSNTNGIGTGSRIQIYKLAAEKVADITVATNSTQVDIPFPTGTFDPAIDKDSEYLLVSDAKNATATSSLLNIFPNDLTTATNYHAQQIAAIDSSTVAVRHNDARYQFLIRNNFSPTPTNAVAYTHIKLSNIGAFTYQSYSTAHGTSTLELYNYFGSSTSEAITSITKLNIVSSTTNGIAAGSRFTLYKLYE